MTATLLGEKQIARDANLGRRKPHIGAKRGPVFCEEKNVGVGGIRYIHGMSVHMDMRTCAIAGSRHHVYCYINTYRYMYCFSDYSNTVNIGSLVFMYSLYQSIIVFKGNNTEVSQLITPKITNI